MLVTLDGSLVKKEDLSFIKDLNKHLTADREWHSVVFMFAPFGDADAKYVGKSLTATVYAIKYGQSRHSSFTMVDEVKDLNMSHTLQFMAKKDEDAVKLLYHCE